MKEYIVIKIECPKEKKSTEIYQKINKTLKFNRTFFEFCDLFKYRDHVSAKKQEEFEALNLQRFSHIKILEHLAKSPHYQPERDDRKLISNLDSSWEWGHEDAEKSIDHSLFEKILAFSDRLKLTDVITMLFGIDEIEWDGYAVGNGTYGYEKAKSASYGGENYLSNSIIISRIPHENKPYTVYLSCEKQFRNLDVINNVAQAIGAIKSEKHFFAPESEDERVDWNYAYRDAELKFNAMKTEFSKIAVNLPNKLKDHKELWKFDDKINVRKNIKKYLCTNGWEIRTNDADRAGIIISKHKKDDVISVAIVSQHNGHYLQMLIYYDNIKYTFGWNPGYSYTLLHEKDICMYLENIKFIRDFIDKKL